MRKRRERERKKLWRWGGGRSPWKASEDKKKAEKKGGGSEEGRRQNLIADEKEWGEKTFDEKSAQLSLGTPREKRKGVLLYERRPCPLRKETFSFEKIRDALNTLGQSCLEKRAERRLSKKKAPLLSAQMKIEKEVSGGKESSIFWIRKEGQKDRFAREDPERRNGKRHAKKREGEGNPGGFSKKGFSSLPGSGPLRKKEGGSLLLSSQKKKERLR